MMILILEILCCLVLLSVFSMFVTTIFMDFKRERREAELDKLREEWEEAEHRKQMEFYNNKKI